MVPRGQGWGDDCSSTDNTTQVAGPHAQRCSGSREGCSANTATGPRSPLPRSPLPAPGTTAHQGRAHQAVCTNGALQGRWPASLACTGLTARSSRSSRSTAQQTRQGLAAGCNVEAAMHNTAKGVAPHRPRAQHSSTLHMKKCAPGQAALRGVHKVFSAASTSSIDSATSFSPQTASDGRSRTRNRG